MDAKTAKHVNYLYRSHRTMWVITLLGLIATIAIPLAAGLGWVYAWQRKRLLQAVDRGEIELTDEDYKIGSLGMTNAQKIDHLRNHPVAFFLPTIVLGLVVIVAIVIVSQGK